MLPRVLEPRGQVVERVPPRDVIDQEGARSAAVVRARDGAERLLAGLWGHERRIDMRPPACLQDLPFRLRGWRLSSCFLDRMH